MLNHNSALQDSQLLAPLQSPLKGVLYYIPLIALLLMVVLWVALEQFLIGSIPAAIFIISLFFESNKRRLYYLALFSSIVVLTIAPINTDLNIQHVSLLLPAFIAALVLPTVILWRERPKVIDFNLFPKHIDWVDVLYTIISIPLAWAVISLYFNVISPEVPFNWTLGETPNNGELFGLFMGINGVGIWDELFFINISFAIIRRLFAFRVANPAQAVIYTGILWDMAFRGTGFFLVYIFALTQGAMFERSKALIWVLIVHLIVDYFLFQIIVNTYYPDLKVWWHL